MTNLLEWKNLRREEEKLKIKNQLREGIEDITSGILTEEELELCKEEYQIEEWSEIVEFTDVDLEEVYIEESTQINHIYEFVPNSASKELDIVCEMEYDLFEQALISGTIGSIRDLFFAEDFEYEVISEAGERSAKIVFKRSKGDIVKKKICGKGMKLKGNKCIPQTGTEKAKERKKGIKLKRAKRAMGAGAKKKATIKSKITKRRVKSRTRSLSNTEN